MATKWEELKHKSTPEARAKLKRSVVVETPAENQNKKPIMVRIEPQMIARIDHAAKRLGISRSAFIVSSAAVRLESME